MAPLKILLVNDYAVANGGAELQMLAIRDGLRARGHRVRLFASDASLVPGWPVLADRICRGRTDLAQVATQTANPSAFAAMRREIAEHRPDIVHIRMFLWQLSPLILPALGGTPTLYQAAVYKAICPTGLKLLPDGAICDRQPGRVCLTGGCVRPRTWAAAMAQLALLRLWRHRIDRVAALSGRMAGLFTDAGWGPVEVLSNGVDARPGRPPLGGVPIVAYAGRLAREKGVETLLAAFARIAASQPDARLLIAGTGPLEDDLRARAAPLGARVTFLGHLPRAEMERAFDAAWVQVVPSLWHEPFGNVSTEAMMRGTAVIAADVGGQSDIVRPGTTGWLVPPGDAAALADRLGWVLAERARAEAMGAEGRRIALAEYSRDAVLDRLEETYRGIITARTARGRFAA